MTSKRDSAEAVKAGTAIEIFSHEVFGHFNITETRALIGLSGIKPHKSLFRLGRMVDDLPCDPWDYLFSNRDLDKKHAALLTEEQLIDPAIVVLCPPGTNGGTESHLIIDGVHRLYERKRRGKPDYYFFLLPLTAVPRIDDNRVKVMAAISEAMMPELAWGEYEFRDGGLYHRKTGERRKSDIPGYFENGKRVDKENKK